MTDAPQQDDFERDIISIVAHDLKTPISSVKGFIELMEHAGPLTDMQKQFAEKALGGLERMEQLVVNLLDLSRIESGLALQRVPCNLRELVQEAVEVVEALAFKRGIKIHFSGRGNYEVMGDPHLLSQVVSNLLGNAIKYNHEQGEVFVALRMDGSAVRFEVRDTGIGIPQEDLPHVFRRFYRANVGSGKVEGSGLGLAIAEMVIEKHAGRIWVTSESGKGSTFSFTIPAARHRRKQDVMQAGESMDGIEDHLQDSKERLEIDSKSDQV